MRAELPEVPDDFEVFIKRLKFTSKKRSIILGWLLAIQSIIILIIFLLDRFELEAVFCMMILGYSLVIAGYMMNKHYDNRLLAAYKKMLSKSKTP